MNQYYICLLLGILFSLLIAPLVIKLSKRLKVSQTILHYVEEHSSKQGTPTMGGFIFIFGMLIVSLMFLNSGSTLALVTIGTTLAFGVLGFLDDFIKIHYRQNEGLKPYQKIIGQVGISLILAFFIYNFVGTDIILPFSLKSINIGLFIFPFVVFVFLAVVNSVNLIDGLDGLSTGVSSAYILGFLIFSLSFLSFFNLNDLMIGEYANLFKVSFAMLGSLIAFFVFNCYPAKIFMGDTGALALGGFIACLSLFTKNGFIIPIIGIMFVITACSDILQVLHYKRTKKRIFLMAPLHHHFQKKGMNENRIVVVYIVITMIVSILNIIMTYFIHEGV